MKKLEEKLKNKKLLIIILIVIILLQVVTRIYVGTQKQYFHIDEIYSYALMNYDRVNIFENEDFYNNWHTSEYFKDYIELDQEEVGDLSPVYINQKNDVHPPAFYLLLRIATLFTVEGFSKWTGIILNIIIFILSSILVYLISNKISKNKVLSLIICTLSGFTYIALDRTIYIRMYELTNLNILLITYLHLRILNIENLKLKHCIFITPALLLGGLTHYHFFIFALALYIMYTVKCIREKTYRNLIAYNVSVFMAALAFLLVFPHAVSHIFFGYRGLSAGDGIGYFPKIKKFLEIIFETISGNFVILIPFLIFIITRRREKQKADNGRTNIEWIIIPTITYFLVVVKNAPYIEQRYMMPIASVIVISVIYLIWKYLIKYYNQEHTNWIIAIFAIMMLITPVIKGNKLAFTYSNFNNIADRIKEKQLPIIYVLDDTQNRILDDLYLFTLVDKTIIINTSDLDTYKNELEEQSNYIFICNNKEIEQTLLEGKNTTFLQHTNACDIWEVKNLASD